jgi:hypothetical protein
MGRPSVSRKMSVTILIPTHGRPEMLREALEAILRQSAIKDIDRIVISDNGDGDAAELVVRRFYHLLPIDYTKRNSCSAYDHAQKFLPQYFSKCPSKYTAICHDDDWWQPGHLATAIHAMEAIPSATFYSGCHFDVRSMNSMLFCTHNFYAWFASNFASLNCAWIIPSENSALACLFGCIGHYSTMVMRTESFKKAAWIYDEPDANFDNDRRIQFALSQAGMTVYNPTPQVFVRHHDRRDCVVNFTDDERVRHLRMTTQWMLGQLDVTSVMDRFCAGFDDCPKDFRNNAAQYLSQEWTLPEIARYMKKNGIKYDKEIPGISRILLSTP